LVEHFLNKYCNPVERKTFTQEALKAFMDYDWPGNVRELENAVERLVALTKGREIGVPDLPDFLISSPQRTCDLHLMDVLEKDVSFDKVVKGLEKRLLFLALQKADGNKSEAARLLKMKRETFRDKLEKYGLEG
ncbi:MAG: hypothetical protein HY878_03580, partial [Deltaproteobacteria bacterium]|nr:hypothetical protein [Deltaproteobacteria bacterium]